METENEKLRVCIGNASLEQHPNDPDIYTVRIGSTFITVWMGKRWANSVSVHNANDTHKLKVDSRRNPYVDITREGYDEGNEKVESHEFRDCLKEE